MTSRRRSEHYEPRGKTKEILDRALKHVHSVPYKVSIRWVFYRLLQEGFFGKKGDYNSLVDYISRARHAFLDGWHPALLADETRQAVIRGDGSSSVPDWLREIKPRPKLDFWKDQESYIELWFEARAMREQFEQYSKHVTLVPFGGQPSIPYKWEASERLSATDKPITILYFGDLDPAGVTIARVGYEDVLKWCAHHFDFYWIGLDQEQVERYGIPENPDKPGEYQWEALPDDGAEEIISGAIADHVDLEVMADREAEIDQAELWLEGRFDQLADEWEEGENG